MRQPVIAILVAAAMGLAVSARGAEVRARALADFDSFITMRVAGGVPTAVSLDQAAEMLKDADVVFVGELHDHIANHLAEMALLRALSSRTPKLALSMEQFERDAQPVVDGYLAGKVGEQSLKDNARAWPNYNDAYRPLVEYAKQHGVPVIAANAPAGIVRCVAEQGVGFLKTLPADHRGWVASDVHAEDGPYKQKFLRFLREDPAHGGSSDADKSDAAARAEKSFSAQVTRDDTMAESIADFLRGHPGYKVMHVTGAFHVQARLGTVERLKLRAPGLKIAVILPVEAVNPDKPALSADDAKGADFAIVVSPRPKAYVTEKEREAAEAKEETMFRAAESEGCKL